MTALEQYQAPAPAVITDEDLDNMLRRAKVFAASGLVPKAYQDKPNDIVAVDLSLRPLGSQADLNTLKHCFVIDGAVSFSAQFQLALVRTHGHDAWFDEASDDTFARVNIRLRGSSRVHRFRYTIDMARRARLLDGWVENWQSTGNGKRYCAGRYVVSTDGVPNPEPPPDWAAKEIAAGKVKRRDPWFDGRENQLMCRVATRAIGKTCPEVLLGMPDFRDHYDEREIPTGLDPDTGEIIHDDDDDIVDAELVDDAQRDATEGEPHGASDPSGDEGAAVEADGGAPRRVPADGPGGQDSGAAAPEPVPADEAGGVTAGAPAGAGPQTPRPPLLVTDEWVRHVAIRCSGAGLDRGRRLALIEHAIGRPVTTSKALKQGDEAAAVGALTARLVAGEITVASTRAGLRVVEVDPSLREPGS